MRRLFARSVLVTGLVTSLLVAGAPGAAGVLAGGGCHGVDGAAHTEGTATVIRMGPCSFAPTAAHVPRGTEVRFLNTSQVLHIVAGEGNRWGSNELLPGASFSRRFDADGVYPYSCPLHPGMVGSIVVGDAAAAVAASKTSDNADAPPLGSTSADATSSGLAELGLAGAGGLLVGLLTGLIVRRRRGSPDTPAA